MARKIPARNGGTITIAEKGDVLNPKGRGKGTLNFKTVLERYLDLVTKSADPITGEVAERSMREQIVLQLIAKAQAGDLAAIKDLLDREMGKPSESVKLLGDTQQPVAITAVKLLRDDGISDPIE
jgi:hypothetical protein